MDDNVKLKKKSGFATAALVLGIVAICTSFIPIINNMSFVLALIGFVFAVVSLVKKASKGMAIISLILCVLSFFIVVKSQQSFSDAITDAVDELESGISDLTGDHTQEILENSCDVTICEFSISKGSYGLIDSSLPVTVTNKTKEKKSFSIQIEAVDADGNRIKSDYVYADSLTAGQSQQFTCFDYTSDEDYKKMQTATFNIVEVSMY